MPPLTSRQAAPVVAFYASGGMDHRGRTLRYVLAQDDDWWEREHDFIQWVFPTPERSMYNAHAPSLKPADADAMRANATVLENLQLALQRARRFWGLDGRGPMRWVRKGDHNHLRLTRALKSLDALGLTREARQLQEELLAVAAAHQDEISLETARFWREAIP